MIFTEGQCFATATLYFPANVTDMMAPRTPLSAVVWYSKATADAAAPSAAARHFAAAGRLFAGAHPRPAAALHMDLQLHASVEDPCCCCKRAAVAPQNLTLQL